MSEKEDISMNAVLIFSVMRNLMSLDYIDVVEVDGLRYTTLYRNMILLQIPRYPISTSTLSKLIKELEDVKLIDCVNKNKAPSYRFTDKGNSYIYSDKTREQILAVQSKTIISPSNRKKPLFELNKPALFSELKPEYYGLLREHCLAKCKSEKIPQDQFDAFVDNHSSKGKKFTNFMSAFRTWCRNYKKFNSNDGESTLGKLEL